MRWIPRNLVGSILGIFVECRARRIQDPVQRLRYLQSSMALVTGQPILHPLQSGPFRKLAIAGLALFFGVLLIPKYKAFIERQTGRRAGRAHRCRHPCERGFQGRNLFP